MTYTKAIDQYIQHLTIECDYSKLTIRNYRRVLETFSTWLISNRTPAISPNIEDLDIETVRLYRLCLSQKRDQGGQPLSQKTQTFYILPLRSLLRFLIENDCKTLEPSRIKLPKHKDDHRQIKFLDKSQVDTLLGIIPISTPEGLRDRAIIELLFSTGLRVSELVALNRIPATLEKREFIVTGKGNKTRIVFISDTAYSLLQNYLSTRHDTYQPMFISQFGNKEKDLRLSIRSIQRIIKKYVKIAQLPIDATVHTLRHSFATDLLRNGCDLRSVQEMLGHKNIATTQIYTHVTNQQLKNVYQKFHSGNK
jgi:site-specific recombinase XerD